MLQGVNKLNQGAASLKTFPRSCGVGKEYSLLYLTKHDMQNEEKKTKKK